MMVGALLAAAIVLTLVSPRTSARRLDYWAQSVDAWRSAPAYPWLGIGAGKLSTVIVERGKGCCMPHAHNVLVSTLAEGGLVSAALLLLGLAWWWAANRARLEPWQIGLAAALLVWSLVDEPLYFPGPMMIAALLLAPDVDDIVASDGLRRPP
jgi:O-antigen ligase